MLDLHTLLPPERLPLLVTGISGVAGFNALAYFQQRYPGQVIGVRPTQTWQLVGFGIEALNTEDRDGMLALFQKHGFRSVLNTTGNCALKSCELDPAMASAPTSPAPPTSPRRRCASAAASCICRRTSSTAAPAVAATTSRPIHDGRLHPHAEDAVIRWLDESIAADLFVTAGGSMTDRASEAVPMDESVAADLRAISGVAACCRYACTFWSSATASPC